MVDSRRKVVHSLMDELKDISESVILVGPSSYSDKPAVLEDASIDFVCVNSMKAIDPFLNMFSMSKDQLVEFVSLRNDGSFNMCHFIMEREGFRCNVSVWGYSALENIMKLEGTNMAYFLGDIELGESVGSSGFNGVGNAFEYGYIMGQHATLRTEEVLQETSDDIYLFESPLHILLAPSIINDGGIQFSERTDQLWEKIAQRYCKKFGAYSEGRPFMNSARHRGKYAPDQSIADKIEQRFILEIAKIPVKQVQR